jgi:hypothetical protein
MLQVVVVRVVVLQFVVVSAIIPQVVVFHIFLRLGVDADEA